MSNYLRYFTDALHEIVREIGFEDITIKIDDGGLESVELVASVGITGDIHGFMMLRSDMESAHRFISRMLSNMGIDSEEEDGFGQFHKEAIGEIVNQVSGRSTMMLAEQNIDCNITPPTIISGKNISSDISSCESSISHVLQGEFGNFGLFIGIKSTDLKE